MGFQFLNGFTGIFHTHTKTRALRHNIHQSLPGSGFQRRAFTFLCDPELCMASAITISKKWLTMTDSQRFTNSPANFKDYLYLTTRLAAISRQPQTLLRPTISQRLSAQLLKRSVYTVDARSPPVILHAYTSSAWAAQEMSFLCCCWSRCSVTSVV
jgi:hypothetical protein